MNYTTIRVNSKTHKLLKELAKFANIPLHKVVDKSVEYYAEKNFWEDCQQAYSALRSNKKMWEDELEERKTWDEALLDDID